jgi:hypothetical protein
LGKISVGHCIAEDLAIGSKVSVANLLRSFSRFWARTETEKAKESAKERQSLSRLPLLARYLIKLIKGARTKEKWAFIKQRKRVAQNREKGVSVILSVFDKKTETTQRKTTKLP